MTLQDRLEQAGAAAARLAGDDEAVEAVLPAQPGTGGMLFLIAYGRDGDLSYLALDDDHRPVADRRQVRDAVAVLALVERAEEASGAVEAHRLAQAFTESAEALRVAGMPAEAAAAADVAGRAERLGAIAAPPRVATPQYLDGLAAAGAELRAALADHDALLAAAGRDAATSQLPEPLEAAWRAAALAQSVGATADLSRALADTTGAVEALADDVVERYRAPLV